MAMQGEDHPYIPRDLKLTDYVPPFLSQSTIVSIYGIASLLVVSVMWILSGALPTFISCAYWFIGGIYGLCDKYILTTESYTSSGYIKL